MTVSLARSCPRCRNYFGVVIAQPEGREKSQPINGRCNVFGYEIYSTLLTGYAQTAVDKIPKELAKLARAKDIPADWTSPHKHRGC